MSKLCSVCRTPEADAGRYRGEPVCESCADNLRAVDLEVIDA